MPRQVRVEYPGAFYHVMVVVTHQHPGMDPPSGLRADLAQTSQDLLIGWWKRRNPIWSLGCAGYKTPTPGG